MSSYRRFISYMHQYAHGKKGAGCGFVKVEIRNNTCTLWFQLKKMPSSDILSISFFIPEKNSVTYVPIWSGTCPNGTLNQRFSTDSLHLFNTNYSFRQCAGIILSKNEEIFCGSCWDTGHEVPKFFSNISTHKDASKDTSDTGGLVGTPCETIQSTSNTGDLVGIESKTTHIQEKNKQTPRSDNSDTSPIEEEKSTQSIPFEDIWANMQKKYPPLDPFEEGSVVEGIKVAPSDLPAFDFLPFDLSANRFLLHGYKNYKHLLMGRMEGQNRYILGIPGVYDSQEQFMAKMFGFPCFKPIRTCMKPTGQFGYWFRCIRS